MGNGPGRRERRPILRYGAAAILALLCWLAPIPASAQADGPLTLTLRGDESPETIRKLVEALSVGGRKVEIRIANAPAPNVAVPAASNPTPPSPASASGPAQPSTLVEPPTMAGSRLEMIWDNFVAGFDYGNAAIPRIVDLPGDWSRAWVQNLNGATGLSAGLRVLACLVMAFGAALLFRRATASWFARRLHPSGAEFTPRLIASSYGLLQDLACIAVLLAVGRLTRGLWLPADDLALITFRTVGNGAAIGMAYIAVGRFLLAPGAPERRLLPLPRAERHFFLLTLYAIATPVVVSSALLAQRVASSPEVFAGFFAVTGLVITLFKIWWFYDARHDLKTLVLRYHETPGPGLRLLATSTPWFYIACSIGIWAVGRAAPMMNGGGRWAEAAGITQLIIVLAPILAVGVSSLLACRQAHHAALVEPTPLGRAVGIALRAAAGGVVWAGGLYLMARLWAGFLLGVSTTEFAEFSRQATGVAFLGFGGWVALVFLRAFFDAYTPRHAPIMPGDEDAPHEESVPSRLATVLPVMRGVVLSAVIGLTGLVVLSRLGVDIGPLLAGFGILGLAISFGSQALVRDIVTGFFFMLEDAFRVGEYVDNGRLKGTVEKISLRSVQLRHQSGQIHTVPFGQIAALTNSSRDWATVKFNVRLDHSADIEVARKTIKKTGIAMMEDPEYGPHFIAPLKMQGVADITDSAIVIRLKFTAKPNQASGVQREALKRIYRALNEAKVPFASNAVTVRGGAGNAESGAAAAIAAVPPPSPLAPAAG
jgi:small-conductance mechanosensitive channel